MKTTGWIDKNTRFGWVDEFGIKRLHTLFVYKQKPKGAGSNQYKEVDIIIKDRIRKP